MTGDLVNLRRARKAKARSAKESEAAANRAAHGLTRGERDAQRIAGNRFTRMLDGYRREIVAGEGDGDGS